MGKPKDINQKAQDYLDAHKHVQHTTTQLRSVQHLEVQAKEALEKAEDALTDCVGDNIQRRAFHIDGNTVLVEYLIDHDRARITVLNEDGEVRI